MAYVKQNWKNLPDQSTPLSAARLLYMETQFDEAVAYTDEQIDLNPGPQGPQGPRGDTGSTGAAGTITSATATGLPEGTDPTVTLGGTASARTIAFGIPAGAAGEEGPQGPQGPGGDTGATGPSGTITGASASGLAAGAPPTVSLGGTASARTFAFGIPAGAKGDPGADGTSVNVLGTLPNVGSLPASGAPGDAYIIAGNLWVWSANSNDWTNAGPFQGPKGDDGGAGTSATITSATASGLAPGASPTVTLGGTASARTFAFGIPAGADGAAGAPGAAGTITSATATGLAAGAAPTVTLGGTANSRTFAFGIPAGAQGATGNTGASGTITSATATGLSAGATPTVTLGGTASARTMAFGIPAGAQGNPTTVNGKSGSSITLTAGDVGAQSKTITNVSDFGAVGDGVADDTTAFNNAVTSAGTGGVLSLSPGKTYLIRGSVKIKTGMTVNGNGATLMKNGTATSATILWNEMYSKGYGGGGVGITLRDLNIRGLYTGSRLGVDATVNFMHVSNLLVENCNFSQGMLDGHYLDLMGCDNVRVVNSTFSGMNPLVGREIIEAIQLDCSTASGAGHALFTNAYYDGLPTRNIQVRGCTFEPLTVGGTEYATPKPLGAHSGALVGDDGWYQDIWFESNLVKGWMGDISGNYWQGWVQLPGARNVVIRGNTFSYTGAVRGSGRGSIISSRALDSVTALADVSASNPTSTALPQPRSAVNWVVSGNTFTGFSNNYSDSASSIIYLDAPHNNRISVLGNVCSDSKAPFLTISSGTGLVVSNNSAHVTGAQGGVIQVSSASVSVSGNSVSGSCAFGVLVTGGSNSSVVANKTSGCTTGIRVSGVNNGIVSENYVADYTSVGIDVGDAADASNTWDLSLTGNRIRTSAASPTASIRIGSKANRLFRWGNRYRDGGPLLDTGVGTISTTALDTN